MSEFELEKKSYWSLLWDVWCLNGERFEAAASVAPMSACAVDPLELIEHPELDPLGALKVIAGQGVPWNALPLPSERTGESLATILFRQTRQRPKSKRPAKSLKWLAAQLGKHERTVRRYCESGVVPEKFAWRTSGGHWRVSSSKQAVFAVRRAMEPFERRPKKTKADRDVQRIIKRTHIARRVALTALHKLPEDEAHLERLEPLSDGAKGAAETVPGSSMLHVAIRYLYLQGIEVTGRALAGQLGFSRATLYRRYPAAEIERAVAVFEDAEKAPMPATKVEAEDASEADAEDSEFEGD